MVLHASATHGNEHDLPGNENHCTGPPMRHVGIEMKCYDEFEYGNLILILAIVGLLEKLSLGLRGFTEQSTCTDIFLISWLPNESK